MKKVLLATLLGLGSFSANAAYVCTADPVNNPESCTETTSPYATAKDGDVITMQNGVSVPVTPKIKVVAAANITFDCSSSGDLCSFKGAGFDRIEKGDTGVYNFVFSEPLPDANYTVSDFSCPSKTVFIIPKYVNKTETGFTLISGLKQTHYFGDVIKDNDVYCSVSLTVTAFNE
ncbi:MAG TPA: hypothetical protein DCL21_05805 [Alphaproteobacteria bacterium]|nr:hypothetical protein [Alphaproteobacteria bacterium]